MRYKYSSRRRRNKHNDRRKVKPIKARKSVFLEVPGMELAPKRFPQDSNRSSLPSLYPRGPPNVPRLPIKSNPHSRENTGSQLISESMRADVFYNFSQMENDNRSIVYPANKIQNPHVGYLSNIEDTDEFSDDF